MSAESLNPKKVSLLSLPTELRLEMYEHLPISTFVKRFRMWEGHPHSFEFSIVHKGTASLILATCRQISAEAWPILARKMDEMSRTAPGILVDLGHLPKLVHPAGPLLHFDSYMCLVAQARKNGNTFSLVHTPVIQPGLLNAGSTNLRSFALTIRKLILIMEKRQTMSQSSGTQPLELDIGVQNTGTAYGPYSVDIFWMHEAFAAPLRHQHVHGVLFRYTLRPVTRDFGAEDIDQYYQERRMHDFATLTTWERGADDFPVHVLPGSEITDEEFEDHWSL